MELEELNRKEVAHEAAREWRDEDVDDQKVAVRAEEANERGDARAETKNRHKKKKSATRDGAQKSNPLAADDARKGDREAVSQERGKRRSMQRVLGARNSNPIAACDWRCEQKNTD